MNKICEKDWEFLKAAAPELQDYLLSQELYWPSPLFTRGGMASGEFSLTLGNVLLSLQRLRALTLPEADQKRLEELAAQVEAVRNRWRSNWGKKAQQEFKARLALWRNYLDDLRGNVERFHSSYANAVRWRAILHLLNAEVNTLSLPENETLAGLDGRLRAITSSGSFVWEAELQQGFPPEPYWFLYRAPQPSAGR